MGKVQQVKYNEAGLVTEKLFKSTNGTEQIVQKFAYNANGSKTLETDGKGNTKYINYDTLGRIINITAPDPKNPEVTLTLAAYDYDLNGNKLSEYNQYGNKTSYVYDAFNRLTERIDASGKRVEKLVYDNDHKQIRSIDAIGNGVAYKYDLDGQLLGESKRTPENTLGNEAELKWNSQKYDLSGKLIEKTDRLGHKTKFNYDVLDRLTAVENALGEKTAYSYDLNGNIISQTDGNGNTTLIEYNEKGLMTRRVDPDGRTEKDGDYVYDPALTVTMNYNPDGTAKTMTDRNGNDFEYKYDALGRMVKTTSGKEFVTSAYDPNGNLTKSANNSTEIMRLYDSFNRTVQKSVKGMGTSSFDYGDQGEKKATGEGYYHKENTVDIKGNTLTQTFDENGRLKAVEDGQDKTEYVYNDNGSKAQTLYPGGISTNYTYNPDNTVKSLTNQSQSGVIDNYSYQYDDCGNMVNKTDSSGTTVYTYDPLNRIKTIVEPSKKVTEYEYDAAGNRVRERMTGGSEIITKDYTYNKQNRLMEIVKHDLTGNVEEKQKFVYDNNGNQLYFKIELTERATEDAKPSFGMFISGESYSGESAKKFFESNSVNTYNVFNQLIKTTVGDVEVRHKYDPEGKRIEKVTVKAGKSKTIKYLRLGNEIAMEVDEKGDVISRNVNGTAPISRETDGNKYFLLYNGEGDVTALVDRTGRVAERYEYDAFGNVTKSVDGNGKSLGMGESKNPVRYRGYEYDEETKLYYLNARMYDPSIARFIQEDSYRGNLKDPLSLNLYTYCHNNPVYYNDPTGHAASAVNKIERNDPKGTAKNKPSKPATTKTPAPAPKTPSLDQKVSTGTYNKTDIDNMNDKQLLKALSQIESRYDAAKKGDKAYYDYTSKLLKAELQEQNVGNKIVSYYVALGDVKDAKAEISKNTFVPLDAKVLLGYVDKNGDLGNKNVISATTSSTTNANTKKEVIQVVDNKVFLQSPVNGKLFKASYNDKTHQMNPDNWNGFTLSQQVDLKTALSPDKPGDSREAKFAKTGALLSLVMISGSAGDTAFEGNLEYQKMATQNTASILGKTARNADAPESGSQTALALYDAKYAAKQMLTEGKINLSELESMVPNGAVNGFKPSATIADGYKYNYTINGSKIEIKWHAPDANAAAKFPGSNSGNGWTAQIKVDGKLLGLDGNFYKNPSNLTHIPVMGVDK